MSTLAISNAFRAQVRLAVGPTARVVFENTEPANITRPYYKTALLPGETQAPSFGVNAKVRAIGVYQVSVTTDAGIGEKAAGELVDGLLAWFYRGLTFTAGTAIIIVEKSWRSPAIQSVDSYTVPVSIRYWADIEH